MDAYDSTFGMIFYGVMFSDYDGFSYRVINTHYMNNMFRVN